MLFLRTLIKVSQLRDVLGDLICCIRRIYSCGRHDRIVWKVLLALTHIPASWNNSEKIIISNNFDFLAVMSRLIDCFDRAKHLTTALWQVGYAGQNFPSYIFPSMVGRPILRAEEVRWISYSRREDLMRVLRLHLKQTFLRCVVRNAWSFIHFYLFHLRLFLTVWNWRRLCVEMRQVPWEILWIFNIRYEACSVFCSKSPILFYRTPIEHFVLLNELLFTKSSAMIMLALNIALFHQKPSITNWICKALQWITSYKAAEFSDFLHISAALRWRMEL